MIVEWSVPARSHLDEALSSSMFYGPVVADRLLLRVEAVVNQLIEHPYSARTRRVDGTREVVLRGFPYILVFRVDPGRLMILAIRHAARDWPGTFPGT